MPGSSVAVAGYADGSPGYVCTQQAFDEEGYEPGASRVAPHSESLVKQATGQLLGLECWQSARQPGGNARNSDD